MSNSVAPREHIQVLLAKVIAHMRHAGQVDKSGRDYYEFHLTPIAELLRPYGPLAEAVGWLHDVVEDTGMTVEELLGSRVEAEVAHAVGDVSRVPGETYQSLIDRSSLKQLPALGKLADNSWNVACNPFLAASDPDKADSLLNGRYLPARTQLIAGAGLSDAEAADLLNRARALAERLRP